MITRSEGSWLRRSRRNSSGRIRRPNRTKPIQQRQFHQFIEKKGGGYSDHRVDGYQDIRIKEETYTQIDGGYPSKDNQMEEVDGIGSITEQKDSPVTEESGGFTGFFEENAAGNNQGGGAAPINGVEILEEWRRRQYSLTVTKARKHK